MIYLDFTAGCIFSPPRPHNFSLRYTCKWGCFCVVTKKSKMIVAFSNFRTFWRETKDALILHHLTKSRPQYNNATSYCIM